MRFLQSLVVLVILCSCSPVRQRSFTYSDGGEERSVNVLVPRGYRKETKATDAAGNTVARWDYGKAVFYVAYLRDSNFLLQPIDTAMNIPRISDATGALVFKGQDKQSLYWREVRQPPFRVGYQFVAPEQEYNFDSASNYAAGWKMK